MNELRKKFLETKENRHTRQQWLAIEGLISRQEQLLEKEEQSLIEELGSKLPSQEELNQLSLSKSVHELYQHQKNSGEQFKHYLQEKLTLKHIRLEIKHLEKQKENLKTQLKKSEKAEQDYQSVVGNMVAGRKEDPLKSNQEIRRMIQQSYEYEHERIGMNDVLRQGELAVHKLNEVKYELNKAKSWMEENGSPDIEIVNQKEEYLDLVEKRLYDFQEELRNFHQRLYKVGICKDEHVELFLKTSGKWIEAVFNAESLFDSVCQLIKVLDEIIVEMLSVDEHLRKEINRDDLKKSAIDSILEDYIGIAFGDKD